tara:strand:+ start:483 stop:641 length:159 start_codon:yes stop_codon:yes gene_type:complete
MPNNTRRPGLSRWHKYKKPPTRMKPDGPKTTEMKNVVGGIIISRKVTPNVPD